MLDNQLIKQKIPAIINLFPGYEVITLPWGAAIKDLKTDKMISVYFPDGQELNLENWEVILHDNGIELQSFKKK